MPDPVTDSGIESMKKLIDGFMNQPPEHVQLVFEACVISQAKRRGLSEETGIQLATHCSAMAAASVELNLAMLSLSDDEKKKGGWSA